MRVESGLACVTKALKTQQIYYVVRVLSRLSTYCGRVLEVLQREMDVVSGNGLCRVSPRVLSMLNTLDYLVE